MRKQRCREYRKYEDAQWYERKLKNEGENPEVRFSCGFWIVVW